MDGYGHNGYFTNNGVAPRNEWSKASYASDDVYGEPDSTAVEGRKKPIILRTPSHNAESYGAKVEISGENVCAPMVMKYGENSPPKAMPVKSYGNRYSSPPKAGPEKDFGYKYSSPPKVGPMKDYASRNSSPAKAKLVKDYGSRNSSPPKVMPEIDNRSVYSSPPEAKLVKGYGSRNSSSPMVESMKDNGSRNS